MDTNQSRLKLVSAFAAVYVIWGSTYLAIRYAIETLPALPMAAVRFVLAGSILLALAMWNGASWPARRDWAVASLLGLLYFMLGHGGVVVAEKWVPSSLAALLIASVPLWIALFDWLGPSRRRPGGLGLAGLILGFLGVTLLIGRSGAGQVDPLGALILISSSAAWAAGSVYARYRTLPQPNMLASGMQMLCGGLWLSLGGWISGQWSEWGAQPISVRSGLAFLYLVLFGSLVAFSAYAWLVKATRPAMLATYAYVNPAVAVILGWALAGEIITGRTLTAMAVILAAVVMITSAAKSVARGAAPSPAPVSRVARSS